ncbi:right-handed parallel beta-helix repeat-containing protein [Candidatus Sumerlaeota bacterium]|nr:right-handed parallel beta-helix repeat-containing protein [Candidatus Sumerlaeota bacterium]
MRTTLCLFAVVSLVIATNAFAGDLNPTGSPASTMLTLDQVEARIPITTLPFPASASGSYYLTGDLTAPADTDGITISADHVTIDLNGFSLIGGGGTTGNGIVTTSNDSITICNGVVRDWGDEGIDLFGGEDILIEGIQATNNGGNGIFSGNSSVVSRCVATDNVGYGIWVREDSVVSHCAANRNGRTNPTNQGGGIALSHNSVLEHSTANNNQDAGASSPPLSVYGVGVFAGNGCVIRDVLAEGNSSSGIFVSDAGRVVDCVCRGNGSAGVSAYSAGVITGCVCSDNDTSAGITAVENSVISGNTCYDNAYGIVAASSIIRDNICSGNTNEGITGTVYSHIQGNTCRDNNEGIQFDDGTIVINNFCAYNTTSSANQYVSTGGFIGFGSSYLVYGPAMTTTNAWANLEARNP